MFRLFLLGVTLSGYVVILQVEKTIADSEIQGVQSLYTAAYTQAAQISDSNR